jgi:hypothetical protein
MQSAILIERETDNYTITYEEKGERGRLEVVCRWFVGGFYNER